MRKNLFHFKITSLLPIILLMLVGCAIPLQRSPDPEQEQAEQPRQERNMAQESTSAEDAMSNSDESDEETVVEALQAAPTVVPESASETTVNPSAADRANVELTEEGSPELAAEILDLAALDQTFLETIDAARRDLGTVNNHRFIEFTDARGITWQGEALIGDAETILLMQPMQAGGQIAARLVVDAANDMTSPEFEAALAAALATLELDLPAPDGFGPPDAEIQFVEARESSPGVWRFNVRLNHPDTGWEDYTDGWHVETLDGQILGVRILLHPHVNEMPFSRSQGGITIPNGVTEVQIRSHDLVSGYSQETVIVPISESGSGERYEVTR